MLNSLAPIIIEEVALMHIHSDERAHIYPDEALTIGFQYRVNRPNVEFGVVVEVHNDNDVLIYRANTAEIGAPMRQSLPGKYDAQIHLDRVNVLASYYSVSLGIIEQGETVPCVWHEKAYVFKVKNKYATSGIVHIPMHVTAQHDTFVLCPAF